MKHLLKVFLGLVLFLIIFTSCATFQINIMNEDGGIIKEHSTAKLYVGVGALVPDAAIGIVLTAGSVFYPIPYLKSSIDINAGWNIQRLIMIPASLMPVRNIGYGTSGSWVIFYDNNGNIISYSGFNYSITRKSKLFNE